MKYFEFFDIPVAFLIDEGNLRKQFLLKSKQYHPDFYTLESEEKQAEILELSTLNNEAYKVLNDADKRMKYILEEKHLISEKVKNQMPPEFLMEMMEVNEEVMELQFDFDADKYQKILKEVQQKEDEMLQAIQPILESYTETEEVTDDLKKVRDYYLKKRYILRLKDNIAKIKN